MGRDVLFNTVEFGPELTLRFPRPFVPARWFAKSAAPRTTWTALYNYQRRPDYNRTLARTSLGLEWTESPRATVGIFPVDLNIIRIPFLTDAFRNYLQQANDPVLTALGSAIRRSRRARGIAQEELARRSAIDRSYMSSIERGGQNPGIVSIARIAKAMEMSMTELMAEAEFSGQWLGHARR